MKVLLNGIEIDKALLTVNDGLNYGRFFDRKTEAYEIQLSDSELMYLIEKEYIEARDEIKLDDEMDQDTSDFTNTNYCSLRELLAHESDFEEVMKTYLHITLFKKIFADSPKNQYVINSTDLIRINNDTVILKGRVFKLKQI